VVKTDYWDIDAMADAIHALTSYPGLHESMKKRGIEEMREITWEKAGQKVIDIYKSVLSNY
jgi:glycosyltransferase involved in cell wall biosynthesis